MQSDKFVSRTNRKTSPLSVRRLVFEENSRDSFLNERSSCDVCGVESFKCLS